jgi:PAS domain S-box-containing protein
MEKKTILIIEKDAKLIELLGKKVEGSGYKTVCLISAKEALDWLKNHSPFLMILDYSLQEMNGKEFILSIQQTGLAVPPYIVAAENGDVRTAVDMMNLGARDYIKKDAHFLDIMSILIDKVSVAIENDNKRKNTEQALVRNETVQGKMIANIGDVIVIIDQNGINRYKSPNIEKWFGWKPEDLMGKNSCGNVHAEDLEKVQMFFDKILAEPNSKGALDYRYRCKDGSYKWIEFTAINLINDPDIKGILGNYHDITEQKKAEQEFIRAKERAEESELMLRNINDELGKAKEQAEESDHLKTSFLNNISHEIRTPFNGILGFLSLLQDNEISVEERDEYISIVNKSAYRLMNTINDIVEISQIQAGQMKLSVSETNIRKLTSGVYAQFKSDAESNGLGFYIKNDLPGNIEHIYTDSIKLNAILSILIGNAIKFTKTGAIQFGIRFAEKVGKNGASSQPTDLEFFVKDTGIGIPKDKQHLIFERFMQVDSSNTRQYEGSGLGLSIAKAYVEMLEGKIWVESEEGDGATFYFSIPFNTEPETKKAPERNIITEAMQTRVKSKDTKLKILLAEDDDESAMLLDLTVKPFSKEIIKVKTGVEAIEACRNNPDIDLVLMDIKMPDLNGHEATRQIRKFNKEVIIIAQTAYAQTIDREQSITYGCNDYISKPIVKVELLGIMQKHFNI